MSARKLLVGRGAGIKGVPAKSLLGNRFVGRYPLASVAAVMHRGRVEGHNVAGSGVDGGGLANKAIPEERLGQPPSGRDAASRRVGGRHHRGTWNHSAASGGNRNRNRYGYP